MAVPQNGTRFVLVGCALRRVDVAVDAPLLVSADAGCVPASIRESCAPSGDGDVDDATVSEAFSQTRA
jgi:hypothetical protein